MSQHDMNIANQGYPATRSDINNALVALATNSSGATQPATRYAYQWWYDTTSNILKMRNRDNDAWINIAVFDQAADSWTIVGAALSAIDAHLLPDTENTRDLGSSSKIWREVFANNVNGHAPSGLRNAIINGRFDIWQRGTSFTNPALATYGPDRWRLDHNGTGGTTQYSRQSHSLGLTTAETPVYSLFYNRTVATSGETINVIQQRIEDVQTFEGKTVTLSFYARTTTTITLPEIFVRQYFGTGGSPSTQVDTTVATNVAVLSSSFAKFSYSFTLPSTTGKTLGTDSNHWLAVNIRFPLNDACNINITNVQLQLGAAATPFERRPLGLELAFCQRYYFKTFPQDTAPAQNVGVTGAYGFGQLVAGAVAASYPMCAFPVEMRAAPTITGFNPSAANANPRNVGAGANYTSATYTATPWGWYLRATGPSAGTAGQDSRVHITADAEF